MQLELVIYHLDSQSVYAEQFDCNIPVVMVRTVSSTMRTWGDERRKKKQKQKQKKLAEIAIQSKRKEIAMNECLKALVVSRMPISKEEITFLNVYGCKRGVTIQLHLPVLTAHPPERSISNSLFIDERQQIAISLNQLSDNCNLNRKFWVKIIAFQ